MIDDIVIVNNVLLSLAVLVRPVSIKENVESIKASYSSREMVASLYMAVRLVFQTYRALLRKPTSLEKKLLSILSASM